MIDFFEAVCRAQVYTTPSRGCVPCPARYGVTIVPALRASAADTEQCYGFCGTLVYCWRVSVGLLSIEIRTMVNLVQDVAKCHKKIKINKKIKKWHLKHRLKLENNVSKCERSKENIDKFEKKSRLHLNYCYFCGCFSKFSQKMMWNMLKTLIKFGYMEFEY